MDDFHPRILVNQINGSLVLVPLMWGLFIIDEALKNNGLLLVSVVIFIELLGEQVLWRSRLNVDIGAGGDIVGDTLVVTRVIAVQLGDGQPMVLLIEPHAIFKADEEFLLVLVPPTLDIGLPELAGKLELSVIFVGVHIL